MADLIHCITNPISMMLCANAVLALGAKPIMAEHPLEVKEITEKAQALLLNLGNISDTRMEAMRISFKAAIDKEIPVVIDAVGIGCSELRRKFLSELLDIWGKHSSSRTKDSQTEPSGIKLLIKGNYSEIKALADETYTSKGVDASGLESYEEISGLAKKISGELKAFVLASGARDIMTDGDTIYINDSGHQMMSMVTGTGCMLGAICATFLAKENSIDSLCRACISFGIAGERAVERLGSDGKRVGTGSFQTALLDELCFSYETAGTLNNQECTFK